MPTLEFEKLPAERQNPVDVLRAEYSKTSQFLKSQYADEARTLEKQTLSDAEFRKQAEKLNAKYKNLMDRRRFQAEQQMQQFKSIKSLVNAGQISSDAGNEAMWRMALPEETERAMFPKEQAEGQPYSLQQLTGESITESIRTYAGAAPDKPGLEWGPPKKTKEGLVSQYLTLRSLASYDTLSIIRQRQFDMQWDAMMKSDEKYNTWWLNKEKRQPIPEIRAMRSTGRIGKAMRERITGTRNVSPLGRSVAASKKPGMARLAWDVATVQYPKTSQQPPEQPSESELRRQGTQKSYEKGVKLGYWE